MNTDSTGKLLKELHARFGNDLQVLSPQGERFSLDGEQAVFVLSGAVDLFFAERKADGASGFSLSLCPRMEAGTLIPPMVRSDRICYYGRCLPDSEIVLLPWPVIRDGRMDADPVIRDGLMAFSAALRQEKMPQRIGDLIQTVSVLCEGSEKKLQEMDLQTQKLIHDHSAEQQRQSKHIFTAFASLLQVGEEKNTSCDPADPVAAAAALTAEKNGIRDFTFARGVNTEHRMERSAELNHMRITPARLEDGWHKENFAPMLVISQDGRNAYCAFRNRRNDPVAWCGATGKLYVIDRDFCQTLQPAGWNFVIPLPAAPLTPGK